MAPGSQPANETQYPGPAHGVARGSARAQRPPSPRPPTVPKQAATENAVGRPASGQAGPRAVRLRRRPRRGGGPGTHNACPCSQVRRHRRGPRSGRSSGRRGRRAARSTGRRARGSLGRQSPGRRNSGARRPPPSTCRHWRRRGPRSRPSRARSAAPRSPRGSGSARRGPGPGRARLSGGRGVRGAAWGRVPLSRASVFSVL